MKTLFLYSILALALKVCCRRSQALGCGVRYSPGVYGYRTVTKHPLIKHATFFTRLSGLSLSTNHRQWWCKKPHANMQSAAFQSSAVFSPATASQHSKFLRKMDSTGIIDMKTEPADYIPSAQSTRSTTKVRVLYSSLVKTTSRYQKLTSHI